MTERHQLLQSIANIMVDYRTGEIPTPTPEHVDRWVRQFSPEVQLPLLAEMNHVLARTYLNKLRVETFLAKLVNNPKLAGADFCAFWRNVAFLNIQQGGNSQHEMLTMFSKVLQQECGFSAQQGLYNPHAYIYLDQVARQTSPFRAGRIAREAKPPYVRSVFSGVSAAVYQCRNRHF